MGFDQIAHGADVLHLDVAAVLAQMQGDAVGTGHFGGQGGVHGVGIAAAARLAQRGYVVDVDAEGYGFVGHAGACVCMWLWVVIMSAVLSGTLCGRRLWQLHV